MYFIKSERPNQNFVLLPHFMPWASGLPHDCATNADFSMLMIFSTSFVMCLQTQAKSTFFRTPQHSFEGEILGPAFWTNRAHCCIRPWMSPWHCPWTCKTIAKKKMRSNILLKSAIDFVCVSYCVLNYVVCLYSRSIKFEWMFICVRDLR